MAHSTVTSKGQITIPKAVRKKLNLKTGDKIDFIVNDGYVRMIPLSKTVSEVFGILSGKASKSISVEEINIKLKGSFAHKYK
jgi:antitoxin PrlF